jgi:hypothetical protein
MSDGRSNSSSPWATCEVCGRTAADVAWQSTYATHRPRWLCSDQKACYDAYTLREIGPRR